MSLTGAIVNNKNHKQFNEKFAFDKVMDQIFLCESDFKKRFTSFLQEPIAENIVNLILREKYAKNVYLTISGGIVGASRVQIGICTVGCIKNTSFPIKAIEIKFNKFDSSTTHRNILGSILGIGVDRNKIGDIFIFKDKAIVLLDESMLNFLTINLTHIGKNKVQINETEIKNIFIPLDNYKEVSIKLENIKLSTIISKAFNINRENTLKLLKSKKVSINWNIQNKDITAIHCNEVISVRGYGRLIIQNVFEKSVTLHVYR